MTDYIFDIDGTLANCAHRRQFVATKPKNWKAFYAGVSSDLPIEPVLHMLNILTPGNRIILCSGREELYRPETEAWLTRFEVNYETLYMRKLKDYRADDIIKEELLAQMRLDGYNPTVVFDDRKRVVDMWVRNGLFVFDVAQGQGNF